MEKEKRTRTRWLTIRLDENEEQVLLKFYRQTTCRSLSEYARIVVLKQPVIVKFRNASADDFLEECLQLKRELNAIGININQAVHKLHTLDHVPEINAWARLTEQYKQVLLQKEEEILKKMTEIYDLWLRK